MEKYGPTGQVTTYSRADLLFFTPRVPCSDASGARMHLYYMHTHTQHKLTNTHVHTHTGIK